MSKPIMADLRCKHCSRFITPISKPFNDFQKCPNSQCKKIDTYKVDFVSNLTGVKPHTVKDDTEEPRTV